MVSNLDENHCAQNKVMNIEFKASQNESVSFFKNKEINKEK